MPCLLPLHDAFVPNKKFNLHFAPLFITKHLVVFLDQSDIMKQILPVDGLPSGSGPLIPWLNLGRAMTWSFHWKEGNFGVALWVNFLGFSQPSRMFVFEKSQWDYFVVVALQDHVNVSCLHWTHAHQI